MRNLKPSDGLEGVGEDNWKNGKIKGRRRPGCSDLPIFAECS